MQKLHIIKIGGTLIDDKKALKAFLAQFSEIEGAKILIHGGGKLAETLAEKLKITQTMIDGRRITNKKTLKVVTMVYAGRINKNLVAKLQSFDCNAIGFSGADGNVIKAEKRQHPEIDFGFVGDIDEKSINHELIINIINLGLVPVFSAITHDKKEICSTPMQTRLPELSLRLYQNISIQNYCSVSIKMGFWKILRTKIQI
jgi:acetylglutamate kinase